MFLLEQLIVSICIYEFFRLCAVEYVMSHYADSKYVKFLIELKSKVKNLIS